MFHDLDATLAALLDDELSMPGVTISFASPDARFPPAGVSLPAVALFLYQVWENHDLRTSQRELDRQPNGMTTRKRPPVRVDCSYLITAWPSASAPDPTQDEHRLLGEAMKVLSRHRRIPAAHLRGELVGQEPPVPAKITAADQLRSLGEFWQAMGGQPKATLHYTVTVSLDVFEAVEVGPPVTSKVIEIR